MRVLVFGASITQGFWDTEGGWVGRLRKYYDELAVKDIQNQDDYPVVINLGISGDRASDLLTRFKPEVSARLRHGGDPVVIFSIGTNNAYVVGDEEWTGTESYKSDLEELIKQAKKFTNKIMFVNCPPCEEEKTTPVFWKDISYTNERISAVNAIMRQTAEAHSISLVDVFDRLQTEMAIARQLFADGLHPNNEGHQLIFELVRPALDKLLI